jgi:hypothetical protein
VGMEQTLEEKRKGKRRLMRKRSKKEE